MERLYVENLERYYDITTIPYIEDTKEYYLWLVHTHPTLTIEEKTVLGTICTTVSEIELDSLPNTILQIVGRKTASDIAEEAYKIVEGSEDSSEVISNIRDLCDSFTSYEDRDDTKDEDWKSILSSYASTPGYKWSLDCLNRSLGDRHGGELIILGARPDVGKTTLAVQEAVHTAKLHPEETVILWNNEEARSRVIKRVIQTATHLNNHEISDDPDMAYQKYRDAVPKDNIKIIDTDGLSVYDIAKTIERYAPVSLIVFDQLAKVGIGGNYGNDVQKLHELAKMARRLARRYAPVLTTCWADAEAEGEKWIEQNSLYAVKTAWQGEADAIITMGRSHDPAHLMHRFLYIPKNKCDGNIEKERNGRYTVFINPEIAHIHDSTGV